MRKYFPMKILRIEMEKYENFFIIKSAKFHTLHCSSLVFSMRIYSSTTGKQMKLKLIFISILIFRLLARELTTIVWQLTDPFPKFPNVIRFHPTSLSLVESKIPFKHHWWHYSEYRRQQLSTYTIAFREIFSIFNVIANQGIPIFHSESI